MLTIFNQSDHQNTLEELDSLLLEGNEVKVLPASVLAAIDTNDLLYWCFMRGVYCLPTLELVEWLKMQIQGKSAIEIGAGHGALGKALGIPATDSKMQEQPAIKQYYQAIGQTTIKYPSHVEQLDAEAAIQKYSPQIVVAAWLTHQFDPMQPEAQGNAYGVREAFLLECVEEYIFIGAMSSHHKKPILEKPHQQFRFDWLYRRGSDPFIAVWHGKK